DGDGPPGRINILPPQGSHLARAHPGGEGHPVKGVQLGIVTDVCHDLAGFLLRPCLLFRSRPLWPTDAAYRVTGHQIEPFGLPERATDHGPDDLDTSGAVVGAQVVDPVLDGAR